MSPSAVSVPRRPARRAWTSPRSTVVGPLTTPTTEGVRGNAVPRLADRREPDYRSQGVSEREASYRLGAAAPTAICAPAYRARRFLQAFHRCRSDVASRRDAPHLRADAQQTDARTLRPSANKPHRHAPAGPLKRRLHRACAAGRRRPCWPPTPAGLGVDGLDRVGGGPRPQGESCVEVRLEAVPRSRKTGWPPGLSRSPQTPIAVR